MAIENNVFDPRSWIVKVVSIAAYPVWMSNIGIYNLQDCKYGESKNCLEHWK